MKRLKEIFTHSDNSLQWNAIANIVGSLWSAVLGFLTIPVFLVFLGAEAFGLVGLFASLQVVFTFLDLGLSGTINREIAINTARGNFSENRFLLRTFEYIYWPIGICIAVVILLGSNWLANDWVNVEQLSQQEVQQAIIIMAFTFAVRWPISLYTGVLRGLEAQILQNGILIFVSSIRSLGAIAIVAWVSPTIEAFLLWHVFATVIEVLTLYFFSWRQLHLFSDESPRFEVRIIKRVWRFAASFNIIGVLGAIISYVDRLIISKTLMLDQLGYYSIASTVAGVMMMVGVAISTAVFPRFSARFAVNEKQVLSRTYHKVVQSVSFLTTAMVLLLVLFPKDFLWLWTHSKEVVSETTIVLSLWSVASFLNALLYPSYTMLIAHAFTKIPLLMSGFNLVLFVPIMVITIPRGGIKAAAIIWLVQNILLWLVYTYFAYRWVLHENPMEFLFSDLGVFLVFGGLWIGGAKILMMSNDNIVVRMCALALSCLGYTISVLLVRRNSNN